MTDRGENFGVVKGWLIARDAPLEIMVALNALARDASSASKAPSPAHMPGSPPADDGWTATSFEEGDIGVFQTAEGPITVDISPSKARKKREWTPEQRAAAAERMRKRQAAKRAGGKHSWGYSGAKPMATALHGETTTYTDDEGRTVTKLPPGFAQGITPGVTAKSSREHA